MVTKSIQTVSGRSIVYAHGGPYKSDLGWKASSGIYFSVIDTAVLYVEFWDNWISWNCDDIFL